MTAKRNNLMAVLSSLPPLQAEHALRAIAAGQKGEVVETAGAPVRVRFTDTVSGAPHLINRDQWDKLQKNQTEKDAVRNAAQQAREQGSVLRRMWRRITGW